MSLSLVNDFFKDYEGGGSYVSKVMVYYVSSEDFDYVTSQKMSKEEFLSFISNFKTINDVLEYLKGVAKLWCAPYIVVKEFQYLDVYGAFFYDRGLYYRLRKSYGKLKEALSNINIRIKRRGIVLSNVMFITITVPHSMPLYEAYLYISKRFNEVMRELRRQYGRIKYVGVLEVHKDGFPHYHVLVMRERGYWRFFRYKGLLRWVDKRKFDKIIAYDRKGFIDVFSFKKKKAINSYLRKYLSKFMNSHEDIDRLVNGSDFNEVNVKSLTPLIARLFRLRLIRLSRGLVSKKEPRSSSPPPNELIELHKLYKQFLELKEWYRKVKNITSKLKTLEEMNKLKKEIMVKAKPLIIKRVKLNVSLLSLALAMTNNDINNPGFYAYDLINISPNSPISKVFSWDRVERFLRSELSCFIDVYGCVVVGSTSISVMV